MPRSDYVKIVITAVFWDAALMEGGAWMWNGAVALNWGLAPIAGNTLRTFWKILMSCGA